MDGIVPGGLTSFAQESRITAPKIWDDKALEDWATPIAACIYATCRDATDSFRVIVPREAVGERCEIMHEVNLLDIELDLAGLSP
jgi:hypothetical protein